MINHMHPHACRSPPELVTVDASTAELLLTTPCGTWPDATRRKVLQAAVAISGLVIIGGFILLGSIAWTVLMGVGCLVLIDVYIQVRTPIRWPYCRGCMMYCTTISIDLNQCTTAGRRRYANRWAR
jgi:hypothetical protein